VPLGQAGQVEGHGMVPAGAEAAGGRGVGDAIIACREDFEVHCVGAAALDENGELEAGAVWGWGTATHWRIRGSPPGLERLAFCVGLGLKLAPGVSVRVTLGVIVELALEAR